MTEKLVETLQKLVTGMTDEQAGQLGAALTLAFQPNPFTGADAAPDATMAEDLPMEEEEEEEDATMSAPEDEEEEEGKAIDPVAFATALAEEIRKGAAQAASTKSAPKKAPARPPYEFKGKKSEDEGKESNMKSVFDAAYISRFGEEDAVKSAIYGDVIGPDYRQFLFDQNRAFAKYLRHGPDGLSTDEVKSLKTQVFPLDQIYKMAIEGHDTPAIKTTMVEAQGTLGGYAVPPNVQQNIITRLPGLTAVRGNGAVVITLNSSNSVEIPRYTGGDDRYVGALRGQWGTETQSPSEQNATLDMVQVPADVYTYKVPMSQSLVEDAANLVALVQNTIATTLSVDEDDAFLVGDGVGKPYGILPAGSNTLSLTEVNSGNASLLTADGIKSLKRGVATQYRKNGKWIGNSDTYSDIEQLKAGDGHYLFEDLSETDLLLNRQALESEAMSDVAANAFPLLFADLSGYTIVERLGLTIVRFQDSYTGINKVEFHVRRRVGGRLAEPWKFAVQKVSA